MVESTDMMSLRKFVAPEFIFGVGARRLIAQFVRNFAVQKVLVVTDPIVLQLAWMNDVLSVLTQNDIEFSVFSHVTSNPRVDQIMAGAEFYHEQNCDGIIALGGGSPIDCSKGIGIVCSNHRHILEFEGVDRVESPMPPLICIPTTGGTSADVSQFAIITNPLKRNKIAIISKTVVPDVSLIDPEILTSMDAYLTACTGMDALVHAIEAFVSNASSSITDLHALEAVRLIHSNLRLSVQNLDGIRYRTEMMSGSLLAGLAFSNASLGAVHAMAHSLGGALDLPHGECNSILLPHVLSFNYPNAEDRFRRLANVMNLDVSRMSSRAYRLALLDEINRLKNDVGIVDTLGNKGVRSSDVSELASKAVCDPCLVTNPRPATRRDIEVLYEEAL